MKRIHLSSCEYLSKYLSYLPKMAAEYHFKPNGLWYGMDDEWKAWHDANNAAKFAMYKYSYELEVDFSNVCVLEELESLLKFHWKYSYKTDGNIMAIDWEKVGADYSGIEVRNYDELNFAALMRAVLWLRNWSVSSGCIWDLSAVEWSSRVELNSHPLYNGKASS